MNGAPHVDVEQIMKQIREDIARKRSHADRVSDGRISADLTALHGNWDIGSVRFTSHRGGIGPFVVFIKRILRQLLTPILVRQVDYNAANTRLTQHLSDQAEAFGRELGQLRDELVVSREAARQAHEETLRRELAQLREELAATREAAQQALRETLGRELTERLEELRREIPADLGGVRQWAQGEIDAVRREQAQALSEAARTHVESVRIVRERTSRAERKLRRILHVLSTDDGREHLERLEVKAKAAAPLDFEHAFDYFGFEERFRGNEEEIQQRQRLYLEHFKGARDVLDIGCGRGEFLELLKSADIEAIGIDADLDMVLLCREKGLAVVEADAFGYLESLPDASVGGIFCAQMIEHLDAGQIIRLVQLSHRKLRPHGVLILETPNPRCLTVFAESFYMDLSHIRLIHPETARFLLECMGFGNVELKFSAPVERGARVPPLPADGLPEAALADFNRGIERLNELLYGYQDYAVIGAKIDAAL